MAKIIYDKQIVENRAGETVLDTLTRANISIPFSCRNGVCHTCMLQATYGQPTEDSQRSLKKSLCDKNYFLACKCSPDGDLHVKLPDENDLYSHATLVDKQMVTRAVCKLSFEPIVPLYYHAGQFINIRRPDGTVRSYSLASNPSNDPYLEIYVKRFDNGVMSNWLIDELSINSNIEFHGPLGECYYRNEHHKNNLLLIGTGTGLSPLQGIVNDAIRSSHQGDIFLYHGCSETADLYNVGLFNHLQKQFGNFYYYSCITRDSDSRLSFHGRATDIAFNMHSSLDNYIVFLAGNPTMVYSAFETAVSLNADPKKIYVDAFEAAEVLDYPTSPLAAADMSAESYEEPQPTNIEITEQDPPYPEPDPELWQALKNGKLLSDILTDFYKQVYQDEKLNGFFKDVTLKRAVEKQYNFLRKVFTGEKVFFGEKPRNAHHWMVISDELFNYRERLIEASMRKYKLPDHLIRRWLDIHESYRKVIVKPKAWNKVFEGVELPLEGFEELELEVGSICDGCSSILDPGEIITYHVRLGTIYCSQCRQANNTKVSCAK